MKRFILGLVLGTILPFSFATADGFTSEMKRKHSEGVIADEKFLLQDGGKWRCEYHSLWSGLDRIWKSDLNFAASKKYGNILKATGSGDLRIPKKQIIWEADEYQGTISVPFESGGNGVVRHASMILRAHEEELIVLLTNDSSKMEVGIMKCLPKKRGCIG